MKGNIRTTHGDAAIRTAELLLEIGAVHFSPLKPFRLSSGRPSPVYMDCRKLISYPEQRNEIFTMMVELVSQTIGLDRLDCLAGGETAGIPYAAFLAERTNLPMAYVRKHAKGHGKGRRIEGTVNRGDRVLLVEDMSTDGASKVSFVDAIRETGATCTDTVVIFYYDIFARAEATLAENRIVLHHLTSWSSIMKCSQVSGILDQEERTVMHEFLDSPERWQEEHMGG